MPKTRGPHLLDVFGQNERAPLENRLGLGGAQQEQAGSRRGAETVLEIGSRRANQLGDVAEDLIADCHPTNGPSSALDLGRSQNDRNAARRGRVVVMTPEHSLFLLGTRILDQDLEEKAVKLCRDIAKEIEEQLTYPGEIKVTLLRETRVVEYAR